MKLKRRIPGIILAALFLVSSMNFSFRLTYADPNPEESSEAEDPFSGDIELEPGQITDLGNPSAGLNSHVVDDDDIGGGGGGGGGGYSGPILPDGIYAFKNLGNTSRWLDVQLDATVPGYYLQQYDYVTSPAYRTTPASVPNCGLYRVTRRASTGTYIILLMIEESLTFEVYGSYFRTKQISTNDALVSDNDTFYIYFDNGGFTIRPYSYVSYYVCAPVGTGSGYADRPGSQVVLSTIASAGNRARWIPEGYHSTLPDGIYSFRNTYASQRYMDIRLDLVTPNNNIQQYSFNGTCPSNTYTRSGLFKVSQVGTTGRYVIRLMLNNRLSFGFDGDWVMTKLISPYDSQVPEADTFTFSYNNGGYIIIPYGSAYAVGSHHQTASGAAGGDDSALKKLAISTTDNRVKWEPKRYTGSGDSGHTLSYLNGWTGGTLQAGTSGEVIVATWHPAIGVNDAIVDCTSSEDIATASWNTNNQTLTLSARSAGTANVRIRITNSGTAYATYNLAYQCSPPFADGVYSLYNSESGKYLAIDDDDAPQYQQVGGLLEQWTGYGENYEKWYLTYVGEGYYRITSFISELVISAPQNEESGGSANLVLTAQSETNDRQKWKIIATRDGMYKLRAKSSMTYSLQERCMAVGQNSANGARVFQGAYSQDEDFSDEWGFAYDYANSAVQQPNPDGQNKNHWCWAASVKMVAEHNTGANPLLKGATELVDQGGVHTYLDNTNSTLHPFYGVTSNGTYTVNTGQRKIVAQVFDGSDGDFAAGSDYLDEAFQAVSMGDCSYGLFGSEQQIPVPIDDMNEELENGYWIVANLYFGEERTHDIVIMSFDGNYYSYWDPDIDDEGRFSVDQLLNDSIWLNENNWALMYGAYCHPQ